MRVGPDHGAVAVAFGPVALEGEFWLCLREGRGETHVPGGCAVVAFCYVVVAFSVSAYWEVVSGWIEILGGERRDLRKSNL